MVAYEGTVAGISSMLGLTTEQAYHAINFAVHNAISSRQSRKGDIGANDPQKIDPDSPHGTLRARTGDHQSD